MSPRPASLVQADIDRLLRAAKKAGARVVEIPLSNGTARIVLADETGESEAKAKAKLAKKPVFLL